MTKKEIFSVVVIVWLLLATAYVVDDQWDNYQNNGIQKAYTGAINDMIDGVEKSNCQPLPIFSGERKVEVVDMRCLQQSDEQEVPIKESGNEIE